MCLCIRMSTGKTTSRRVGLATDGCAIATMHDNDVSSISGILDSSFGCGRLQTAVERTGQSAAGVGKDTRRVGAVPTLASLRESEWSKGGGTRARSLKVGVREVELAYNNLLGNG